MEAAASGMAAQQQNLEVIADNLANADVTGFKSAAATFADVSAAGTAGLGTASLGKHALFVQGKLERSGGPFDLAIDGAGFFCVEKDGRFAYTRAGAFSRAPDGSVRNAEGWRLRGVRIPADALRVDVGGDGRVFVDRPGAQRTPAGRVDLASFVAPERLRVLSGTLFAASPQSGEPHIFHPGEAAKTTLAFGSLEKSNVSIIESMMAIMTAQRAYEANAKGVQAADEMLRIANNLHRS
jgi:flagellar basal-body rod protein FlgG